MAGACMSRSGPCVRGSARSSKKIAGAHGHSSRFCGKDGAGAHMKYFPLVWAGLTRKKLRTLFTLLSIIIAFLLFGLLQGVNSAFSNSVQGAHLDRLVVQGKISLTEQLPFAYRDRIARVAGVKGVTYATWFGGYYQDPKNNIFSYPVDVPTYFKVFPDIQLAPEQLAALART